MMLLDDTDDLYTALLERDPRFEGRVFVGVTTTGIFCRLTCPAKKPKKENTQFFDSVTSCIEAGFRPCKRCHPLRSANEADPVVEQLLEALEAAPLKRWSEADVAALGVDPSTARRKFRAAFGATFLEIARLRRVRAGAESRKKGEKTVEAQLEAGFESPSGFRSAFAKLLGRAPGSLTGKEDLKADFLDTPLGPMIVLADDKALWLLEFADRKAINRQLQVTERDFGAPIGLGTNDIIEEAKRQIAAYFDAKRNDFDLPLAQFGTPFFQTVWDELRHIPIGATRSYKELAEAIGRPTAMRAVARANASNRLAIVIPCHRVIAANGDLAGYAGGTWRKSWILQHEREIGPRRLF
ncbi:MAG: trifunctional transcriptional activator/DNA repair protein Ada/methylated-DNA--[protein]-cysteine S-methyltransferase [Pseudomonadota bacterium]